MVPQNLPNLISVARLALTPAFAYYLVTRGYAVALPIFIVAALSDFADGYIARRFGLTSRLGAALDPVADKLNMLVATLVLASQALLPLWLATAIVARDVLIVLGALLYRRVVGRLDISPSRLSKLNTLLEFALLSLVMASAAHWLDGDALAIGFVIVGATVVASGVQYAWRWHAKLMSQRPPPLRSSR